MTNVPRGIAIENLVGDCTDEDDYTCIYMMFFVHGQQSQPAIRERKELADTI